MKSKISLTTLLLVTLAPPLFSQDGAPVEAQVPAVGPTVVERGLNHQVIQTPTGGQYTEIASGMNYVRNGELVPSKESIVIDQDGYGVADQGQHTARFAPSVTDSPTVTYTDPQGYVFNIRPAFIAYLDYSSGRSVLLCETRESIGTVSDGTVTYPSAFSDGVNASVRYSYRKASFESDIIILAQLPPPSDFNLNESSIRLQVWHELFDPPQPTIKTTSFIYREPDEALRQAYAEPDFKDEFLEFGSLQFIPGHAFLMNSDAIRQAAIDVREEVRVGKEMVTTPDEIPRHFLVESVELGSIRDLLATLPIAAVAKPGGKTSRLAALKQEKGLTRQQLLAALPKAPRKARSTAKLQMASVSSRTGVPPVQAGVSPANPRSGSEGTESRRDARSTTATRKASEGLVLDYVTVPTQTNYTFRADMTYYVSSTVTLSGTNTLEASVIKFATNGLVSDGDGGWTTVPTQISISGSGATLRCLTSQFRPAILTAATDQTVGEGIYATASSPSGYYGTYYLYFDAGSSGVLSSVSNARFLYAAAALGYAGTASGAGHQASHCQFYNCQNVIKGSYSSDVILRNILAENANYLVNGSSINVHGEHLTANGSGLSGCVLTNGGATLYLTNSLLYSLANSGYTGGLSNQIAGSNPFQTVSGGSAYLANNSPYRAAGATNIDASLAADLQKRTTYPPVLFTNAITADTTLSPQAQRETAVPDLGYAYDALDFLLGSAVTNTVIVTNATLTLQGGVNVGVATTIGLKMQTGSKLASTGAPLLPNRLLRLESVQEQGAISNKTALIVDDLVSGTQPEARLRFTDFILNSNPGADFSGGSQMAVFAAQDCKFLGGGLTWNTNGASTRAVTLTNNLFERTTNIFGTGTDPVGIHARNNLFWNGSVLATTGKY